MNGLEQHVQETIDSSLVSIEALEHMSTATCTQCQLSSQGIGPYQRAYMKRWAPKAYKAGDHRALARIHNGGGPNGRKMSSTIKYWNKVRKEMK